MIAMHQQVRNIVITHPHTHMVILNVKLVQNGTKISYVNVNNVTLSKHTLY